MPEADFLSSILSRIPGKKDTVVFIFTGNGGAGKSEASLNFAVLLKNNLPVTFLDLDPVKPCFRSREAKKEIEGQGVKLVMTPVSSLDLPAVSPENAGLLKSRGKNPLVVDLAGEESGIRILGGYRDFLSDAVIFWVINFSRPFSSEDELLAWRHRAESASGLKFDGIVNNTHLMQNTTPDLITGSAERARRLADRAGLPLLFHGVSEKLLMNNKISLPEPVLPLKIYLCPPWEKTADRKS
ncbi:MAG: hypothetical protein M1269_11715 [Chloroflexi bacterium]|nr:hypothetical protein [Chloroflexota bacterium]